MCRQNIKEDIKKFPVSAVYDNPIFILHHKRTGKSFAIPLASAAFLSERQANTKILTVKKEKQGPQKVA